LRDSRPSGRARSRRSKRRCSRITAAGDSCRSWAIQGNDPPLCRVHGGQKGGAQKREHQEAGKSQDTAGEESNGLYSRHFDPHEITDLVAHALQDILQDEIAAIRVIVSRILDRGDIINW
jgi:hypothetical protein